MQWSKWGIGLAALSLAGCGDPLVGDWSGSTESEGTEIMVDATFEKDGTGTMKMEVETDALTVEIDFDCDWEKTDKGEYEIVATCTDIDPEIPEFGLTCDEFDEGEFSCTLSSNKEKLTCSGDEEDDPIVLEAE